MIKEVLIIYKEVALKKRAKNNGKVYNILSNNNINVNFPNNDNTLQIIISFFIGLFVDRLALSPSDIETLISSILSILYR